MSFYPDSSGDQASASTSQQQQQLPDFGRHGSTGLSPVQQDQPPAHPGARDAARAALLQEQQLSQLSLNSQQQQQPSYEQQQQQLAQFSQPASSSSSSAPLPAGNLTHNPDGLDQSHDPHSSSSDAASAGADDHGSRLHTGVLLPSHTSVTYYSQDPISNLRLLVRLQKHPQDASSLSNPQTLRQLKLAQKRAQEEAEKARREQEARERMGGNTAASTAAASSRGTENDAPGHPEDADRPGHISGAARSLNAPTGPALPHSILTQTFGWQQKIHSPPELLLATGSDRKAASYRDGALALLRARFPQEDPPTAAKRFIASAQEGMMLSSMCEHDRYLSPQELHRPVLAYSKAGSSPLGEKIAQASLSAHPNASHLTRDNPTTPYHILATVGLPSRPEEVRLLRPQGDELSGEENKAPRVAGSFQASLLSVRVVESDARVTLELCPGFSPPMRSQSRFDENEWYSFTSPAGDVYRYRIENASDVQAQGADSKKDGADESSAAAAKALQSDADRAAVHAMKQWMDRSGTEFDKGPTGPFVKWHVYGEIIKTSGFEDQQLQVSYELDLRSPPISSLSNDPVRAPWTALSWNTSVMISPGTFAGESKEALTDGLTGISTECTALWAPSSVAGRPKQREAYFGLPLEFKLLQHTPANGPPSLPPNLYITVSTMTRWGHSSCVGYCYLPLPDRAGVHELELQCWEPLGDLGQRKAQFFLGAGPKYTNVKDVGPAAVDAREDGERGSSGSATAQRPRVMIRRDNPAVQATGRVHVRLEIVMVHPARPKSAAVVPALTPGAGLSTNALISIPRASAGSTQQLAESSSRLQQPGMRHRGPGGQQR